MIITLTLNPSLDHSIEVRELRRGEVQRSIGGRYLAGGKGVNVSRALAANRVATTAVLPIGGSEGSQVLHLLAEAGVAVSVVPITGLVRSNVTIIEPGGVVTQINERGPTLSTAEGLALVDHVVGLVSLGDWVVLAGSLPLGVPDDFYATLCHQLHERGARVAVDSSGPALERVLDARPELLKPNRDELAEVTGRQLESVGDAVDAAIELRARGAGTVLASLGSIGAVLVDDDGARFATTLPVEVASTVGAGDSALAGFLAAGGAGPAALRAAVAWGAASVSMHLGQLPGHEDVARITVVDDGPPDRSVAL